MISDAQCVSSAIEQIPGPALALGHSYGGAAITNSTASNIVGLVYVAAFSPDEGETLGGIEGDSRDSVLNSALKPLTYPTGPGSEPAAELYVDPAQLLVKRASTRRRGFLLKNVT